jgi:hypothetical protein
MALPHMADGTMVGMCVRGRDHTMRQEARVIQELFLLFLITIFCLGN